mmetsp:Transcript_70921/g.118752  ORF Transcript_70921/g.118752 Transcript_70921/m.118752 type:complete len:242 (+) Transcript_70921:103-828(+)
MQRTAPHRLVWILPQRIRGWLQGRGRQDQRPGPASASMRGSGFHRRPLSNRWLGIVRRVGVQSTHGSLGPRKPVATSTDSGSRIGLHSSTSGTRPSTSTLVHRTTSTLASSWTLVPMPTSGSATHGSWTCAWAGRAFVWRQIQSLLQTCENSAIAKWWPSASIPPAKRSISIRRTSTGTCRTLRSSLSGRLRAPSSAAASPSHALPSRPYSRSTTSPTWTSCPLTSKAPSWLPCRASPGKR